MSNTFITEDEFENKKMQVIEKLEKMLSLEENVTELTYKGIQRFVSGISQAFGKTFHKGVWLQQINPLRPGEPAVEFPLLHPARPQPRRHPIQNHESRIVAGIFIFRARIA